MAISVVVRREDGGEVDRARLDLNVADLPRWAATLPMLAWVDAYGLTIFNAAQSRVLKAQILAASPENDEEGAFLSELARLCEVEEARPHRYLWFIGD